MSWGTLVFPEWRLAEGLLLCSGFRAVLRCGHCPPSHPFLSLLFAEGKDEGC